MKFYRVKYRIEAGCSNGFGWYTSKAEAERAAKAAVKNDPEEYKTEAPEIEDVEIEATKAGVLAALRTYAGHPDNG
jgi:hypothetical protein